MDTTSVGEVDEGASDIKTGAEVYPKIEEVVSSKTELVHQCLQRQLENMLVMGARATRGQTHTQSIVIAL